MYARVFSYIAQLVTLVIYCSALHIGIGCDVSLDSPPSITPHSFLTPSSNPHNIRPSPKFCNNLFGCGPRLLVPSMAPCNSFLGINSSLLLST